MIPIVSFVSCLSNTGKTTLVEKVIQLLKSKNYRVAVVKHAGHDVEIDQPGKDTWRHDRAGADVVVASGARKIAVMHKVKEEVAFDDIVSMVGDVDIILVEGYKKAPLPKIQIIRGEGKHEPITKPGELVAVVSDHKTDIDVPQFGLEQIKELVGFIEEKYIRQENA